MFLSNEALAGPVLPPPGSQQKAAKKPLHGKMSLDERTRFVLNAIIDQRGCLTLNVTYRGCVRIEPYKANTSTPFTERTAFASETGKWILEIGGTFYYPLQTEEFENWVEQSFQELRKNPGTAIGQPSIMMKFSRVN